MSKFAIVIAIIVSIVSLFLSAAPFTPAIGVSFLMLLLAGFLGFKGYVQSGFTLLFINTLALIISPGVDASNLTSFIAVFALLLVAFGGVFVGVRKAAMNN